MKGNKPLRILIVTDKIEYTQPLKRCLDINDKFHVVAITQDKYEAYHLIHENTLDAVIVDLQSFVDIGIDFLEELNGSGTLSCNTSG